jgi:hypothetical protein
MPKAILLTMETTVSLDGGIRDRLVALATRHGCTTEEEIAAMVAAAEEREFWDEVSTRYADIQAAGTDVVLHDDYPEYAHLRVGDVAAEGKHSDRHGIGSLHQWRPMW